jgi:DNA repair photolyase
VRWDELRLTEDAGQASAGTLPLLPRGAVSRTFDTPEFAGMTFHEVTCRSALNKVPDASRMPFRWTVNPYRGCSMACVYCLAGDTPILMADGRPKPLAEVQVGDDLYGTRRVGLARQYVVTTVSAHWQTTKRAYRITLADGTRIVASADHRFLTERGWKHVTGKMHGAERRPHLTTGNSLLGFGAMDPAITRKRDLVGFRVKCRTHLDVVAIEDLGLEIPMFDITTGTGDFVANGVISHNCFARKTHEYLDLDSGADFDSQVVVKTNVGEVLRRELRRPSWAGEHVAMGTNVDCYQRVEGRYRLMREVIPALTEVANPFSILTKGALILRDLDLLVAAAEVTDVSAALSVGSVDRDIRHRVEPGAPPPARRLEVVRRLTDAGIPTGVLMAPVLPFLTDSDEQLEQTVAAVAASGATHVSPIVLHLRPGAREWWQAWLRRERPDLLPRYAQLYGSRAYAPKAYQDRITSTVRRLAELHGVGRERVGRWRTGDDHAVRTPVRPPPASAPAQLALL